MGSEPYAMLIKNYASSLRLRLENPTSPSTEYFTILEEGFNFNQTFLIRKVNQSDRQELASLLPPGIEYLCSCRELL